nr:immunoglobulin light chain junction region [Macaca mulatta]MOW56637.1 immunoglobulin light chain junction region [Macaca mulatta]
DYYCQSYDSSGWQVF